MRKVTEPFTVQRACLGVPQGFESPECASCLGSLRQCKQRVASKDLDHCPDVPIQLLPRMVLVPHQVRVGDFIPRRAAARASVEELGQIVPGRQTFQRALSRQDLPFAHGRAFVAWIFQTAPLANSRQVVYLRRQPGQQKGLHGLGFDHGQTAPANFKMPKPVFVRALLNVS